MYLEHCLWKHLERDKWQRNEDFLKSHWRIDLKNKNIVFLIFTGTLYERGLEVDN